MKAAALSLLFSLAFFQSADSDWHRIAQDGRMDGHAAKGYIYMNVDTFHIAGLFSQALTKDCGKQILD